jgi:hypothetical protein
MATDKMMVGRHKRRWAFSAANQRLRRAIMDENGGGTGVGGMREMHKTEARHSIFMAG